ncbi:MAG: CHAT domain-containing protein [Anaerolineae bacterium]|nr:CHAT domain-containing protein [Anaerolineae bacterium]
MAAAAWQNYRDFYVSIERDSAGQLSVQAEAPDGGEASCVISLPVTAEQTVQAIKVLAEARFMAPNSPLPPALVEFGSKLYEGVFSGTVRDLYIRARYDAESARAGLRIQLRLNQAPDLAPLPWEVMFDGRDFLALAAGSPIVRYLELANPARPLQVGLPLRVLVTISSPDDLPPLDAGAEKRRMQAALGPLTEKRLVEITFSPEGTLSGLQSVIRAASAAAAPFHVWHFIGHGLYDEVSHSSMLMFRSEGGSALPVTDFQLGTLFNSTPELRLALLNACEGARAAAANPYSGVAAALVTRGIPAVIGMQFEISEAVASLFAGEFYASLVDGLPVEAALTEARRAIFLQSSLVEWATPILFMRTRDGQLFDTGAALKRAPAPRPTTSHGVEVTDDLVGKRLVEGMSRASSEAIDGIDRLFGQLRKEMLSIGRPARAAAPRSAAQPPPTLETPAAALPDEASAPQPDAGPDVHAEQITEDVIDAVSDTVHQMPTSIHDIIYLPLPHRPKTDESELLSEPWRIVLELYIKGESRRLIGLDLYGEAVLGRGTTAGGETVIFNLEPFGARPLGVSRRHLRFKPTAEALYAIDENSTNGSSINGELCTPGEEMPLASHDALRLGKMDFMVYFLKWPGGEAKA